MSYSDFEKGISKPPFCHRSYQNAQKDNELSRLATFAEMQRRLKILRLLTGGDHEPTDEEITRWIEAVKKP